MKGFKFRVIENVLGGSNMFFPLFLTSLVVSLGYCNLVMASDDLTTLQYEDRASIVSNITDLLIESYIFPEMGVHCGAFIHARLLDGDYETFNDQKDFAKRLTEDLRSVCHDKHMTVIARSLHPSTSEAHNSNRVELPESEIERLRNYDFQEVKILEGNVGYLDLRGFSALPEAAPTAVAAMNFLANADAVIIDLRKNGGGCPTMVQIIASYFFKRDQLVHLMSRESRFQEQIDQTWTIPYVPGPSMLEMPLFLLTSSRTFSAAESFAYGLQQQNRATLIGQTTKGGAHPIAGFPLTETMLIYIPYARAINPISGTNWEGVGVKPHVEVSAEATFDKGLAMAQEAAARHRVANQKSIRARDTMEQTLLRLANKLVEEGRSEEAIIHLTILTNAYPKRPTAWRRLIELQCRFGMADQIEATLARAMDHGVANEGYLDRLGYALLGDGHIEAATKVFEFEAKIYTTSTYAYGALGEVYRKTGKIEQAIKAFERSIMLNPHNEFSVNQLNEIRIKSDKP